MHLVIFYEFFGPVNYIPVALHTHQISAEFLWILSQFYIF